MAAALGGAQPAAEPRTDQPATAAGGAESPADPAYSTTSAPDYAGAASMSGSDDFFVGRSVVPAAAAPPPAPPAPDVPAGSAKAMSEPAALTEEDLLHTAPAATPEEDDLLHPGRDFELHSDFEADVVFQATQLPGRSAPGSKRRTSIIRRLGWGFWIAAGWVVLMILVAVLANVLPLSSDTAPSCIPNSGPMGGHLLGCDDAGRDVLARVIFGSRVSLVVGFASIAIALVVGGTLGVMAGFLRGAFDSIFGIITNVILAFPYLVLGLAIVSFWGHNEFQVTIFIAIVAIAPLYRVVRANTIAFAEREYVLAAIALGSTRRRVLMKQIVPDVIPTGITYGLVGVAIAVVGEGALSYLGQSVGVPTPTWGNMIAEGAQLIPSVGTLPVNLWIVFGPAIAMFLFILAINLIGDRLRSILDVREGVL
jgi:peptide/nickel transport system permease protein